MRILVLAPPPAKPQRLTAYTFIDEELFGLAHKGIEPFVISPVVERDDSIGNVRVLAIRRDDLWKQRVRAFGLMVKHRALLPAECIQHLRICIHRIRLEAAAAEAVRDHGIDVIHSHFGPFCGLGGLLARAETGVPLVATFRGMDLLMDESIDHGLRRNKFYSASLPILIETADITTYASEFMREEGLRLGADPSYAITIRKGVDLDRFQVADDRLALRGKLGVDGPLVLTVAGLIRLKGIDTIIRAIGRLRDTHDFTLVVCGAGPEQSALQRLSRTLGMADRVQFRGYVPRPEIQDYFAACDVFVLGSRMEAAGNVVLEAMAAGRPVITTDSGGPSEYVQDEETGYVVPVDDDETLALRLRSLLDDSTLRERFGAAGRHAATAGHGYDMMLQGFMDAYRWAASRRAVGSPNVVVEKRSVGESVG